MHALQFLRTVNEFFWMVSSDRTKFYEGVILFLLNGSVLLGAQTVEYFF